MLCFVSRVDKEISRYVFQQALARNAAGEVLSATTLLPLRFSRFALIAGGSSTPTDKPHLLGTPHARGPSKSLEWEIFQVELCRHCGRDTRGPKLNTHHSHLLASLSGSD